ncbi:MAG: hypothetical protein O2985_17005 [Proteobacteria bacterium]|nr:hypothetical protein [Pseudomonadota bacterium]
MDGLDYWRLCDHLSIVQAALLVCDFDPADYQDSIEESDTNKPAGYEAAKAAISNALSKRLIGGELIPHYYYEDEGPPAGEVENSIDLTASSVEVGSLRSWLAGQNFRCRFFSSSSTATATPDYLDTDHPRYAPKLAAAVNAWLACADESTTRNMSPKKALEKWLRDNASKFALCDKQGNLNKSAIEQTAMVANWKPGGGAPKTSGG